MEEIQGGVAAPLKFKANGIACGIKNSKKDLALIYSEASAHACGVFTRNMVKAAPVMLSSSYLACGRARAVIINSGNANAATGARGMEDARLVSVETARRLGVDANHTPVFSTGIIGKFLPVEKIINGLDSLIEGLSETGGGRAAEAILTTDTFIKQKAVSIDIGGVEVRLGAMAKGSGMIAPDMATMLCFITTDAVIEPAALSRAFKEAVKVSFNSITVDGDCSTNDSVLVLANGASGNKIISGGGAGYRKFKFALLYIASELSRMIVKDGEGATKFFEVKTRGARTLADAKKVCFGVCNSLLVKTAVSGENPNWGRILSAAGSSGAFVDQDRISVFLGGVAVFKDGSPAVYRKQDAEEVMKSPEIIITVDLGLGGKSWSVFSADLSEDYVRINKEYS